MGHDHQRTNQNAVCTASTLDRSFAEPSRRSPVAVSRLDWGTCCQGGNCGARFARNFRLPACSRSTAFAGTRQVAAGNMWSPSSLPMVGLQRLRLSFANGQIRPRADEIVESAGLRRAGGPQARSAQSGPLAGINTDVKSKPFADFIRDRPSTGNLDTPGTVDFHRRLIAEGVEDQEHSARNCWHSSRSTTS
jgi:hypothetical protein